MDRSDYSRPLSSHASRPYKGAAAEYAELDERAVQAALAARSPAEPGEPLRQRQDSVVQAGRACLLIGLPLSIVFVGAFFFFAAAVLGVYAMATHRMKAGISLAVVGVILAALTPYISMLAGIGLFGAVMTSFL